MVSACTIVLYSVAKQGGSCGLLISTVLVASFMQSSVPLEVHNYASYQELPVDNLWVGYNLMNLIITQTSTDNPAPVAGWITR